jgi:hypothetical protein
MSPILAMACTPTDMGSSCATRSHHGR